jgi:hypothetical protein
VDLLSQVQEKLLDAIAIDPGCSSEILSQSHLGPCRSRRGTDLFTVRQAGRKPVEEPFDGHLQMRGSLRVMPT